MTNPRHAPQDIHQSLLRASKIEDVVRLVEAGADVNIINKKGAPLLFNAVRRGWSDIVAFLLVNGARVDVLDGNQMPLCMAAARTHDPMLVHGLVAAGMDPFAIDKQGNTAVMVAQAPKVMEVLLGLGLDPNARNLGGETALHLMLAEEAFIVPRTLPMLISAGADPNAKDHRGLTPLMMVPRNEGLIQALVAAGADASMVDNEGKNALHHLSRSRYRLSASIIEALILAGADPLLADKRGKTPRGWIQSSEGERLLGSQRVVKEVLSSIDRMVLEVNTPPSSFPKMTPRSRL